jgi:hypothetical protein
MAWPNPSEGKISISNIPVHATVRLYDVTGKEPRIPVKLVIQGNDPNIDLSAFPPGMYLLHISNDNFKKTLRIVRK